MPKGVRKGTTDEENTFRRVGAGDGFCDRVNADPHLVCGKLGADFQRVDLQADRQLGILRAEF